MSVYSYRKQVRAVLILEIVIVALAFAFASMFWNQVCSETWLSCLAEGSILKPLSFLALSVIRPFVFTPVVFLTLVSGEAFGPVWGTILSSLGALTSGMLVFGLVKLVGDRLAKPWLRSNLPATLNFIRSQDYKIVFALRLIPIIPFDIVSILFGALNFRTRSVFFATALGVVPEAYLFSKLIDPGETILGNTLTSLIVLGGCILAPLTIFEFISRKKGTSMWQLSKAMYQEIIYEVQSNNEIVKRRSLDNTKTPVLLLYGFFSSRRAVTVLEKMLTARGFEVLSFNLGGLLGTFFTRGILETANFIDYKIKRQIERHGLKKVRIVAHSKGGFVGLWWVLKLGGSKYCDKVVTMGTPYAGSRLTYLALVTPLGFLWRDVWQMRPGSTFLRSLRDVEIPQSLKIFCMHSVRDRVAVGRKGIFQPIPPSHQVVSVPVNHVTHFEFLYRRDVADTIAGLLRDKDNDDDGKDRGDPDDRKKESNSRHLNVV